MGTGYVGLSCGACLSTLGHEVVCVDIDQDKIDSLSAGVIPIFEADLESLVNKGIDDDRTATAHCHFTNFPSNLLPGMLVEAEVIVRNKKATILPDDAVVRFGNGQFIFVMISPNEYQMKPVVTGIAAAGKTEVVSGLEDIKPGTIVQNSAYTLLGILKNSGEE